jgi:hypothetical protein
MSLSIYRVSMLQLQSLISQKTDPIIITGKATPTNTTDNPTTL